MQSLDMIINRAALDQIDALEGPYPKPELGEVTLRVDLFAITSNNVTYAIAPEQMGYWDFYPTARKGWGRVPVWGFAQVEASAHQDIEEGTRVYGFLPMSRYLTVQAGKIGPAGFSDVSAHRSSMSPLYSHYSKAGADPGWRLEIEGLISVFRPLFMTAYLLADEHLSHDCFGADQILLSSASSKTAMGMAAELKRRSDIPVIGLTSEQNKGFCDSLGVYDEVFAYQDLDDLDKKRTALVDMAGNAEVIRRVHSHFAAKLTNSCRVGLTHWQNTQAAIEGLDGCKLYFFFAPTVAQDRIKSIGREAFISNQTVAQEAFLSVAQSWLTLKEGHGPEAVKATWTRMLAGKVDPSVGHVLSLRAE